MSKATPLSDKQVVIFTGALGSGKTEVAVNYAVGAQAAGRPTCIVDLDIVTPYYRVGNLRPWLQKQGLRVVAPAGSLVLFEVPALPPEVTGALGSDDLHVVLDVGGDPYGARLLGVYAERIKSREYDMWMVVNPFRPATSGPDSIGEQARGIEAQSGLAITGLVANPHLAEVTTEEDVETGVALVRREAEHLGHPLVFVAVSKAFLAAGGRSGLPLLPLRLMLSDPWEAGDREQE